MNKAVRKKIKRNLHLIRWKLLGTKTKVFCIGRNKTGTTSLKAYLEQCGFYFGDQRTAELMVEEYAAKNWSPILSYCKSAQAFQDAPFSWPDTWKQLVKVYPNAKYILTYRDPESWYRSILGFHSKLFSSQAGHAPSAEDLKNAVYRYKGFMWDANRAVWNTPAQDPYNKEIMIANYIKHNEEIRDYFKDSSNFIEINLANSADFIKLNRFLGIKSTADSFPHLNRT